MTSQTINLNLIPGAIQPIIHVSQYDKGQTWTFNLYAGSQPFSIPANSSVVILGTKKDKTGFEYACSYSGNIVTAIEQQQMTILAGDVPAEIRITKGNDLIGSMNFIIKVEAAALTDETQISETDLPLIEEAIEELGRVPAIITQMETLAQQASTSATTATTKAGEASTSATNAAASATSAAGSASTATTKAGQASTSATNAANSATSASNSATNAASSASTASTKASQAATSATNAANSATAAANSATAAQQAAASIVVDFALSTSSTNPVQNKVITTEINNVKQALSNHWSAGGKNLIPYPEWSKVSTVNGTSVFENNGVTITATSFDSYTGGVAGGAIKIPVEEGKTYILSWEAANTEGYNYIFPNGSTTGMVSANNAVTKQLSYTVGSGITYITFRFGVRESGTTIAYKNIMLRLSTEDATFEPYAKTNVELTKDDSGLTENTFANGAVNLLKNTATSQTINGVTFTVNSDGTITANGTATNNVAFVVKSLTTDDIKQGKYKLSGCPANGSSSTYFLEYSNTVNKAYGDYGSGKDIEIFDSLSYPNSSVIIQIRSGVTVSNLTFKPMLTVADMPNSDYAHYVPYAKSNKELTEGSVKIGTFSGTTNSTGNLVITTDLNKKVIAAIDNDDTHLCSVYRTSNYYGAHITTISSNQTVTSTAVSGTYYYI